MRPQIVKIVACILYVCNSIPMLAQTASPPPPSPSRRPPQAPIDGDLYILIVLGVIYGIYVISIKNKKKNTTA